jgi:hypothetical protein
MVWEVIASTVVSLFGASQKSRAEGRIADMQEEIANRRAVLAELVIVHAKLFWDREKAFVLDTMAEALALPAYVEVDITLAATSGRVQSALTSTEGLFACLYARGLSIAEDTYIRRAMGQIQVDQISHTMRAAEGRAIALNDVRHSRQTAVLALGRGRLQDATRFGDLAVTTRGIVRDALVSTINSGFELWGYASNRVQSGNGGYSVRAGVQPRAVIDGVPRFSDQRYANAPTVNVSVLSAPDPRADENGAFIPTLSGGAMDSADGNTENF